MPICPKCRYEYKPDVLICPDCGEKLLESLADIEIEKSPDDKWIPLVRLTSSHLAEMLREALDAKDIPAVLSSETGHFGITGQMGIPGFRPVGGGYVIYVPETLAAQAREESRIILGDEWDKVKLVNIE